MPENLMMKAAARLRKIFLLPLPGTTALNVPATLFLLALSFCLGCSIPRTVHTEYSNQGRFEYRDALPGLDGVVVGAPHGHSDRHSNTLALALSEHTGAGLVIAYGFKSHRLSVAQPIVRTHPSFFAKDGPASRGSVFKEYREILRRAAGGNLRLYLGVHRSTKEQSTGRIEVATSGLTFEEAEALKNAYRGIRDRVISSAVMPVLEMAIEPLDQISWRNAGAKHHGVLLVAEKGLNLRIPPFAEPAETIYAEILSRWVDEAVRIIRDNSAGLPQIEVHLLDFGRFEVIPSRRRIAGVVVAAPHGSFDEHTAEMVKRLSFGTGITAVIAKGFTPTQAGGWRINVNRPTEKTFPSETLEFRSRRASEVYRSFHKLVTDVAGETLDLYIDIHQYNTGDTIQVATTGISRTEARSIKNLYNEFRDRTLKETSGVRGVEMVIEPLDRVEIGAWNTKAEGILRLSKKGLHFELPSHLVLSTDAARRTYLKIFTAVLTEAVPSLLRGTAVK
ncbi:MAG: hypothetical protein ACREQK_20510 [Candidatus Binatia bacterium]